MLSSTNKNFNIKLIAGRSNAQLAEKIANHLGINLTIVNIISFPNREIEVKIKESIRNNHVFILQTGISDSSLSTNDYMFETLLLCDACKRSDAKSISVILPYFPYSRSDKKDSPRTSISASVVMNLLACYNPRRIITMDLHAGQITGFTKEPVDNLYAINLHIEHLSKTIFNNLSLEQINDKFILVTPDAGGIKRITSYAQKLKMNHLIMNKQRDYTKVSTVTNTLIVGNVALLKDKIPIIIDDIFDSCGTIISASELLVKSGSKPVIAIATHGIFSSNAIEKINNCQSIEKVIVTNTLPQNSQLQNTKKLEEIDVSHLLATVVKCILTGDSIADLFKD